MANKNIQIKDGNDILYPTEDTGILLGSASLIDKESLVIKLSDNYLNYNKILVAIICNDSRGCLYELLYPKLNVYGISKTWNLGCEPNNKYFYSIEGYLTGGNMLSITTIKYGVDMYKLEVNLFGFK